MHMDIVAWAARTWFDGPGDLAPVPLEGEIGLSILDDACDAAPAAEPSVAVPFALVVELARRATIRVGRAVTPAALVAIVEPLLARHAREGSFPGARRPADVAPMMPLPAGDFVTVARCGYWKDARIERVFDDRFGAGRWRRGYTWGAHTLGVRDGIQLYEDAYLHALRADGALRQWLIQEASDVYDTAPSNTLSYASYAVQEVEGGMQHWQDIAIRRALRRLGLWFRGRDLLEVRGHASRGYRLNPGQLPFHRPEMLVDPRPSGWWKPGSIEEFSIVNFAVQAPLADVQRWLSAIPPDQDTSEALLWARDERLLPIMAAHAAAGPRPALFVARALSLHPEGDRLLRALSPAPALTAAWSALHRSDAARDLADKLLSSDPAVRSAALESLTSIDPETRRAYLDVLREDPARRLRNAAIGR